MAYYVETKITRTMQLKGWSKKKHMDHFRKNIISKSEHDGRFHDLRARGLILYWKIYWEEDELERKVIVTKNIWKDKETYEQHKFFTEKVRQNCIKNGYTFEQKFKSISDNNELNKLLKITHDSKKIY